jgi:hypothetical protein
MKGVLYLDSIKITSTISSPKVTDVPGKHTPSGAVIDVDGINQAIKTEPVSDDIQKENFRETLFQNLQKDILKPLMNSTTAQADALRKLVLISELFDSSTGAIPKELLNGIFLNSQDLLSELLMRDKTATIFQGSFFDSLRGLANLDGYPQLKDAIVAILRHYDAYINRNRTLNGIFLEGSRLMMNLTSKDQALLEQQLTKLEALLGKSGQSTNSLDSLLGLNSSNGQTSPELQSLINLKAAQNGKLGEQLSQRLERIENLLNNKNLDYQTILQQLKNETVPVLRQILSSQAYSENVYHSVSALIDHIVRYDKANPEQLEAAVLRFSQALKPLSNLTDSDIVDIKDQLFMHAKEAEILSDRLDASSKSSIDGDKISLAHMLDQALDDRNSSKIINSAHTLLETMVRSESPVFTLMHFLIPLRFQDPCPQRTPHKNSHPETAAESESASG